jgi:hypothetical protein
MKQSAPYPGQGKDIPANLGRGAWISEPVLYLSLDDLETEEGTTLRGGGAGVQAIEIGAARVAKLMGISVEDLMLANREGRLFVANKIVDPQPGMTSAMRFRFDVGDRNAYLTLGRTDIGSA